MPPKLEHLGIRHAEDEPMPDQKMNPWFRCGSEPRDSEYRKLWRACYGAAFALMVRDRMREGRGAPSDEDCEGYAEEAASIACLAAGVLNR